MHVDSVVDLNWAIYCYNKQQGNVEHKTNNSTPKHVGVLQGK